MYIENNYNLLNPDSGLTKTYFAAIFITTNENFIFTNYYHQACNRSNLLLMIAIATFIGIVIGNFLFCFLADVFGRKKVLVLCCIIQILALISLTLFSVFIVNTNSPALYQTDNYRNSSSINIDYYRIDLNYINNLESILDELKSASVISTNFKNYFVVYLFIQILLTCSVCSALSVSLAFILENALNDQDIFWNYLIYMISSVAGYFFTNLLISLTDNISSISFIFMLGQITSLFLIMFIFYESPRYLFEYGDYQEISRIMRKIVPTELDKLYVWPDKTDQNGVKLFEDELNIAESNSMQAIMKELGETSFFNNHYTVKKKLLKEIKEKEFCKITKVDLVRDPILLFNIMLNNSKINKNSLIIISYVVNVSICFFITLNALSKEYIFTRQQATKGTIIFDSIIFWITIFSILVYFTVYWILKFFGYSILLFTGFTAIVILSLLIEGFTAFNLIYI